MERLKVVKDFFLGISRSRISLIGAMLVTVVGPMLLGYMLVDSLWHVDNPYFGGAVYLLLGPVFLTGLAMIFVGAFFFRGTREVHLFTLEYLRRYFTDPVLFKRLRRNLFLIVLLTSVNFAVFSLFLYRAYHYMESTAFCGQFCHTVMNPEYTAYQNGPHSQVACVECHIGSGADWFVKSKISGARQLLAVAANTYPRPIPTPVHGLRPARDTCEKCHRPELFHGDKLYVRNHFLPDEKNSEVHNVLLMKIGSAGDRAQSSHGIHWHVAPQNAVTYRTVDPQRMIIPEVTLKTADGKEVVFRTDDAEEKLKAAGEKIETRTMDCIDCHNRPSHVYLSMEDALNRKMLEGVIPRELPFIKRQAVEVVSVKYPDGKTARETIAASLTSWYQANQAELVAANPQLLATAIAGVQEAYAQNVFPEMNIDWGTYITQIGHGEEFDHGCFRCHDDQHKSADGRVISSDCNTCHALLAQDEADPAILKTLRGE